MAILTLPWFDPPPSTWKGGAIAIGNFDGVHCGHQQLIATTQRWADHVGGPAIAVTFDPSPAQILLGHSNRLPLTTIADRADLLHRAGADHVAILRADADLIALSPEAFFTDVIVRTYGAQAVVEGYNFRFGHRRAGNTETLRTMCANAGITFEEVPPHEIDGATVSSSRVRTAIEAGEVTTATALLGRPYAVRGAVVAGAKRGRTLGFPTANLGNVPTLLPKMGVYAVRVIVAGEQYGGAANIGPNPTFGEKALKVEVHLLDFAGDLYGHDIHVAFHARLRDTKPFAGRDALIAQLQQDIASARNMLAAQ